MRPTSVIYAGKIVSAEYVIIGGAIINLITVGLGETLVRDGWVKVVGA